MVIAEDLIYTILAASDILPHGTTHPHPKKQYCIVKSSIHLLSKELDKGNITRLKIHDNTFKINCLYVYILTKSPTKHHKNAHHIKNILYLCTVKNNNADTLAKRVPPALDAAKKD